MKILHTSDLHLTKDNSERWDALDYLVNFGMEEKIDVLVISGDLFDYGVNVEDLRVKLRRSLDNKGFKTIIIPGNHDKDAFQKGLYFGDDTEVILDLNNPFEDFDEVRFWGFPFENIDEIQILESLNSIKPRLSDDKANILLYHGHLTDLVYSRNDFGDEENYRYMPIKSSYFEDYNFKYILGGHIHTRPIIYQFKGGYFIYPGSPVSITKKETGKRTCILFELGENPREIDLETMHYEHIDIELNPIIDDTIEKIKAKITEPLDKVAEEARIILDIKGYIDSENLQMDESEFNEYINDLVENKVELNNETVDMSNVFQSNLFIRFMEVLNSEDFSSDEKDQIQKYFINATGGVKL